jgi:hypothetical protein
MSASLKKRGGAHIGHADKDLVGYCKREGEVVWRADGKVVETRAQPCLDLNTHSESEDISVGNDAHYYQP